MSDKAAEFPLDRDTYANQIRRRLKMLGPYGELRSLERMSLSDLRRINTAIKALVGVGRHWE